MIFKGVREGRPYPEQRLSTREWAQIPPRQFRLDQLTTVTTVLALDKLLSEDSTFYGDLFAHVVQYRGELYLEDGLHRAVRSALRNRTIIHARLLDLDAELAAAQGRGGAAHELLAAAGPAGNEPQRAARPGSRCRADGAALELGAQAAHRAARGEEEVLAQRRDARSGGQRLFRSGGESSEPAETEAGEVAASGMAGCQGGHALAAPDRAVGKQR